MKLVKVGISSAIKFDTNRGFEGYKYMDVSQCYIDAVIGAGGLPYIIPTFESNNIDRLAIRFLRNLDLVIFSGGDDLNPRLWNEEPSPELSYMSQERDAFELKLMEAAVKLNKAILGICRGAQLLNVFFGGSLYQNIFTEAGANIAHKQKAQFNEASHSVQISDRSITSTIFGKEVWVNSHHHMGIKKLAENFVCTGKSKDNIPELFESKDMEKQLMMGVQWHPEMMYKSSKEMRDFFHLFFERVRKC